MSGYKYAMANEMDSKLLSWIDARTTDKSATCGVVASGSHTLVRPLLLASLMVNALAGDIGQGSRCHSYRAK